MKFDYPAGATPLDPNEVDGLLPMHISLQAELNEWEQANILDAERWLSRRHFQVADVLEMIFIRELHQKMVDKAWRWAGQFRQTNKNIGVAWSEIA
jgi:fido (protein-threonine AMPylation protein)